MCTLLYLKWPTTRTYCIAQGTLLNVTWQLGWEESLGENGYMYMYGWVSLSCSLETIMTLFVNWLSPQYKIKSVLKSAHTLSTLSLLDLFHKSLPPCSSPWEFPSCVNHNPFFDYIKELLLRFWHLKLTLERELSHFMIGLLWHILLQLFCW